MSKEDIKRISIIVLLIVVTISLYFILNPNTLNNENSNNDTVNNNQMSNTSLNTNTIASVQSVEQFEDNTAKFDFTNIMKLVIMLL